MQPTQRFLQRTIWSSGAIGTTMDMGQAPHPNIHDNSKNATFAALASLALQAQSPSLLVSTEWLSDHLRDPKLVILTVESKAAYAAGHIPGAQQIALEDLSSPMDHSSTTALMLELPQPEVLRTKLAAFGISDDSRVVISYGGDGPFQSATRVLFTLDYLGLGHRASILNGGTVAWQKAGKAISQVVPTVKPGSLRARPTNDVVADVATIQTIAQHPRVRLIDARAPVYYRGVEASFGKKGHIPGAVNIPFSEITGTDSLVDREHVQALFRSAGVGAGESVVAYCHVGQQATAIVFAARLLGIPARLYDGSFQDWVLNARGDVVQ